MQKHWLLRVFVVIIYPYGGNTSTMYPAKYPTVKDTAVLWYWHSFSNTGYELKL